MVNAHVLEAQQKGRNGPRQGRELAREMELEGIRFVDRGGRKWRARQYANMVLRTELADTANKANLATADRIGSPGVLVADGGPGDVDEPCIVANGQTWSKEYANLHRLEHPNCRRAFAPLPSSFSGTLDRPATSAFPETMHHVTTANNANAIRTGGFNLQQKKFGRVWGDGVYVTPNRKATEFYADKLGDDAEQLDVRVNVRKEKVVRVDLSNVFERAIETGYDLIAAQLTGGITEFRKRVKEIIERDRENREEARRRFPPIPREQDPAEFERRVLARKAFWNERGRATDEPRTAVLQAMLRRDGIEAIEILDPDFRSDIGGTQIVVLDPKNIEVL